MILVCNLKKSLLISKLALICLYLRYISTKRDLKILHDGFFLKKNWKKLVINIFPDNSGWNKSFPKIKTDQSWQENGRESSNVEASSNHLQSNLSFYGAFIPQIMILHYEGLSERKMNRESFWSDVNIARKS